MNNWNNTIMLAFQDVWSRVINFLPEFIAALLILIIGLIVAYVASNFVFRLINYTKIDTLMLRVKILENFRKAGFELNLARIISVIVKWFFIIITIIAVSNTLHLAQVNEFLDKVLLYIPNIIVAILIMGIGLFIAQIVSDLVEKSASHTYPQAAALLATIVHWSIIIFSLMAALVQLGIATILIEILFTGLVAGLALAFGLAFGLGGREKASALLDQLSRAKTQK